MFKERGEILISSEPYAAVLTGADLGVVLVLLLHYAKTLPYVFSTNTLIAGDAVTTHCHNCFMRPPVSTTTPELTTGVCLPVCQCIGVLELYLHIS